MSVQHYGGVLNATVLFGVASAAYKRIQPEDSTPDPNSINCDSLVPIVFSAAAIEAFFNELPGLLSMFPELLHLEPSQIPIYVQQAKELVNKRDHTGSTGNKYLLAYSTLSGRDCHKGDSPYQDFASLFAARDGILHAKSTTFSGKADPDGKLDMVVSEELLKRFRAKGLLNNSRHSVSIPWTDASGSTTDLQVDVPILWSLQIANPKAARWACNTAAAVVKSIVDVVPECQHKHKLLKYCDQFKPISTEPNKET